MTGDLTIRDVTQPVVFDVTVQAEVLRLIKGKSAGAILTEVKPERAARLTEQLLTTP